MPLQTVAERDVPLRQASKEEAAHGRPSNEQRVGWVDFAKAICIVAVVSMYATYHVQHILHATGWMQAVVEFAKPFRMPDFFLISGLFVSRVLNRPLRSYLDSKVLYFIYFYAVWVTVRFVFNNASNLLSDERLALFSDYFRLYVAPPGGPLWFIYILALFFLAARLLRSVPPWIVLAGAAGIQIAHFASGITLLDKFTNYFIFFYSGYLFAPWIFRLAEWMHARVALSMVILAGWLFVNAMLVEIHVAFLPGMSLLLGYAGAFAVMLLATLFARMPGMGWFGYLGKHSIVVYLGFAVPLGIMRWLISAFPPIEDVGSLSLLVTMFSVAGAVAMYQVVRNSPLRFLFARPSWAHLGTGTIDDMKKPAGPTGNTF